MADIEELNLTVPIAESMAEQQRVLIENFSLLKELHKQGQGLIAAYIILYYTLEGSITVRTTPTMFSSYSQLGPSKNILNNNDGTVTLQLDGTYEITVSFGHDGSLSKTYTIGVFDNATGIELGSISYKVYHSTYHIVLSRSIILNNMQAGKTLIFGIYADSGTEIINFHFVEFKIQRIDT